MKTATRWLVDYFTNPAEVTLTARILTIVLGVILFLIILTLGPVLTLQMSVFNPNYFASYVDDIDISALVHSWLGSSETQLNPVLVGAVEFGVIQLEPQIKQSLRFVVRNVHAFILDRLQRGTLLETIAKQKPAVNDFLSNLDAATNIPVLQSIFTAISLDPQLLKDIIDADQINAYFDAVGQAAQYQNYVIAAKNSFIPLVIFLPILIIGIIFSARKAPLIYSTLGITFLAYGILQFFSVIIASGYIKADIEQLTANATVNDLVLRFFGDISRTLMIYSGIFLVLGLALLTAWFFIRNRQRSISRNNFLSINI
jgi:hypothetical protein